MGRGYMRRSQSGLARNRSLLGPPELELHHTAQLLLVVLHALLSSAGTVKNVQLRWGRSSGFRERNLGKSSPLLAKAKCSVDGFLTRAAVSMSRLAVRWNLQRIVRCNSTRTI